MSFLTRTTEDKEIAEATVIDVVKPDPVVEVERLEKKLEVIKEAKVMTRKESIQ